MPTYHLYAVEDPQEEPIPASREALAQSEVLDTMIKDVRDADKEPIPIHKGSCKIVKLVVKWCEKHRDEPVGELPITFPVVVNIPEWDEREIFGNIDNNELHELTVVASYLMIPGLLDHCCKKIGDLGHHQTPEEMRRIYGFHTVRGPHEV